MTDQQVNTLKKFVAYLAERNEFDPFMYNMAERKIKNDGAVYWDNELRGMPELYQSCKDFTVQQAHFLARKFEMLDSAHTCLPTRNTHICNQLAQEALAQDYRISQQKGWSTE